MISLVMLAASLFIWWVTCTHGLFLLLLLIWFLCPDHTNDDVIGMLNGITEKHLEEDTWPHEKRNVNICPQCTEGSS